MSRCDVQVSGCLWACCAMSAVRCLQAHSHSAMAVRTLATHYCCCEAVRVLANWAVCLAVRACLSQCVLGQVPTSTFQLLGQWLPSCAE